MRVFLSIALFCLPLWADSLDEVKLETGENGKLLVKTILNRDPELKVPISETQYFYGSSEMCKKGPSKDLDDIEGEDPPHYADDLICRIQTKMSKKGPSGTLILLSDEVTVYYPRLQPAKEYYRIKKYSPTGALELQILTHYFPSGSVTWTENATYFSNDFFSDARSPFFQWNRLQKRERFFYQNGMLRGRDAREYEEGKILADGQPLTAQESTPKDWAKVQRKPILKVRKDESYYDKGRIRTRWTYVYKDGWTTGMQTEGWDFYGRSLWSTIYRFVVTNNNNT